MKTKHIAAASLLAFLLGGAGGGAYAYATHAAGGADRSLLAQIQQDREVAQFISEQEELRPDGMNEAKIATGSRYTGITYNNVKPATVQEPEAPAEPAVTDAPETEKKGGIGGFLQGLTGGKTSEPEPAELDSSEPAAQTTKGRINLQSGSLNVRAQGSLESSVLGQVYKDDVVEILESSGSWYHIVTAGGLEGYVSATYVEVLAP